MVNFASCWRTLRQPALVVLGWSAYMAALVIENPLIKALCLVTARALPHVLESGVAATTSATSTPSMSVRSCPMMSTEKGSPRACI